MLIFSCYCMETIWLSYRFGWLTEQAVKFSVEHLINSCSNEIKWFCSRSHQIFGPLPVSPDSWIHINERWALAPAKKHIFPTKWWICDAYTKNINFVNQKMNKHKKIEGNGIDEKGWIVNTNKIHAKLLWKWMSIK